MKLGRGLCLLLILCPPINILYFAKINTSGRGSSQLAHTWRKWYGVWGKTLLLELYNFTKIQLYKVYWRRETIREEIRVQGRNVSDVGQCFGMEYRVESIPMSRILQSMKVCCLQTIIPISIWSWKSNVDVALFPFSIVDFLVLVLSLFQTLSNIADMSAGGGGGGGGGGGETLPLIYCVTETRAGANGWCGK